MARIYRDGFSVVGSGETIRDGSECHPIVNIIFLHGLRGHPRETWETPAAHAQHTQIDDGRGAKKSHGIRSIFRTKAKPREVSHDEATASAHFHREELRSGQTIFWIEDFLSEDIPNARILTYGYNADVIGGLFQANNNNSISQHGRDLAAKLERDLENNAPIIFVAHSLGGIIAKDALHRSKSARQRTKLVVFLGTPHRGSSSADWGQIASNIARLTLQDSNKKILKTLEVNSEVLDNIQEEFISIVHENDLRVHSFQEARGISGMKGLHYKVVDDFSSKVGLPLAQETVETIDANHMQMTKFSGRDNSGYRAVSGVLKAFIERHLNAQEAISTEAPLPSLQSDTAAASTAKVHFMVPFQRNGDLIGREEYIQRLETKLCVPNKFCRVALVGLGGIGKTRIALEYASKYEKSDSVSVFWVHASTSERMEKAYQEIAQEAGLAGAEDPKVNQLQLVKQWLESKDSGTWVMVIDNADDENLFFGEDENSGQGSYSSPSKLARYFPQRLNGSILLTTRNRMLGVKFATVRSVITIPELSVLESKSLLIKILEEGNYDDHELTDLAKELENLPLALVQAAAFIGEKSQLISEYLQTYRGSDLSKIKLLSQNFEDSERDPDSKNPVAVTWAISFEQIRKNDPQAAELLSLMSVLDRQAIPKSLLLPGIEEADLDIALGTLKAFSLITVEQNRQTEFNLHRLVYLATRNWLDMNGELDIWTGKALVLLSDLFPSPEFGDREIWMAYLPHAHTVLSSHYLPASKSIAQASLLYVVSWAYLNKGDYAPAEMMAWQSLVLRENFLGKKHIRTLHSLIMIGLVLQNQGRIEEAEQISRQALDGCEEMLGKEHPDTLGSVDNLGLVLRDQGKHEEAEKLHRRALSSREKMLGKEHPNTLGSVDNLGLVLRDQGKYEEAEKLFRRALSSKEKVRGKEHPRALNSVNNLGLVLCNQGKYEEAKKLFRQALSGREKVLGKEHPDTLDSVNNLGLMLRNQGKFEEAEKLHRRALSSGEKVLGKEHPDTLASVNNLGLVLRNQGKYEEAEKLFRRALSSGEKVLGKEHPGTLANVQNLGLVLVDQGKYEEAERLHRRALSGSEKVLGKEHPDTLRCVWSLANLFHKQGQYQEALPFYQKACAGLEKTLGSDHPDSLRCAKGYSRLLDEMRGDSGTENENAVGEDP